MRFVSILCALAACGPDDAATTDGPPTEPTYTPDPDVRTYVPPEYDTDGLAPERMLLLGDSISAGYGVNNERNWYPELLRENNHGKWPDHDDIDLESLLGDTIELVDVSRYGATAGSVVDGQLPNLEDELGASVSGGTVTVMTVGGNDLVAAIFDVLVAADQDARAEELLSEIETDLQVVVDFLQDPARFPDGNQIYFTNVYDPTDAQGQTSACFYGLDLSAVQNHFDDANARMRSIAEDSGVSLVDMHGHFLGHGLNHANVAMDTYDAEDDSLWFQEDCIHPNTRGHHEIRRLFHASIVDKPLPVYDETY